MAFSHSTANDRFVAVSKSSTMSIFRGVASNGRGMAAQSRHGIEVAIAVVGRDRGNSRGSTKRRTVRRRGGCRRATPARDGRRLPGGDDDGGGGSRSARRDASRRRRTSAHAASMSAASLLLLMLSLLSHDGAVAFRSLPAASSPFSGRGSRDGSGGNAARDPFETPPTSLIHLWYQQGSDVPDPPKRKKRKAAARPSKKNYEARRKRREASSSDRRREKGAPASEEELARHVQSVFSDYSTAEEDEEPCTLTEQDEGDGDVAGDSRRRRAQADNCRKLDRHPALVLNADYQPLRTLPLSVWSWRDAVKAVLSGKAVVVDIYPDVFARAVSLDVPVPSVIALLEYAPIGETRPAFTRRNVFLRDGYRCQYCGESFRTSDLSLDHVEPRCFGGLLTWDNTVTCCRKCNGRKGCLRPAEIHRVGMKLRGAPPRRPSLRELSEEANRFVPRRVHPSWAPFLGL